MPRPVPPESDISQLRAIYELEKGLADRLRHAEPASREALYSEVYDEYFRSLPPEAAPHPSDEQTRLQLELLAPFISSDSVLLEIGSGDGTFAKAIAPNIRQVWAVDASDFVADSGGAQTPGNCIHVLPDQLEERVDAGAVDVAFSCHFLEHLHPNDLNRHMNQVLRALKPGRPYLMVTPNRLHGPHDISGYFSDYPEGFHLREYTHYELGHEALNSGFGRVRALWGLPGVAVDRPLWLTRLVETVLDLLGTRIRQHLFHRLLAHKAPFRPLEQVVLAAWKPLDT